MLKGYNKKAMVFSKYQVYLLTMTMSKHNAITTLNRTKTTAVHI